MRTTVNLEQDVIDVARSLSQARGISLGAALTVLVRRGITRTAYSTNSSAASSEQFPTCAVTESAPSFGTEDVRRALDED